MMRYHDEDKLNHRDINETLEHLERNYKWPTMRKFVTNYINDCKNCRRKKYNRHPPYISLVLRDIVEKPFELQHINLFTFKRQHFLITIDAFGKQEQAIATVRKNSTQQVSNALALYKCTSAKGISSLLAIILGLEMKNSEVTEIKIRRNLKL